MVEGGTTHGLEQSTCVFWDASLSSYIKGARGEVGRPLQGAPGGGVLLLVGVGLPFPTPTRRGKGRRRGRRKERGKGGKGDRTPSPIRFGLGGPHALPPLFHHLAHEAQYFFHVFP